MPDYRTYPTMTGGIPICPDCGALVGDKAVHEASHEGEGE